MSHVRADARSPNIARGDPWLNRSVSKSPARPTSAASATTTRTTSRSWRSSACTSWRTAWADTPPARSRRRWRSTRCRSSSRRPPTTPSGPGRTRWTAPRATRRTGSSPASSSRNLRIYETAQREAKKRGMGTTFVGIFAVERRRLRRARRRQPRLPLPRRQARAAHRGPLAPQRLHQDEAPHRRGDRELPAQERDRARARHEGHGQGRHALRGAAARTTSYLLCSDGLSRPGQRRADRRRSSAAQTDIKTAPRSSSRPPTRTAAPTT